LIFEDHEIREAGGVTSQCQQNPAKFWSSSALDQCRSSDSRHQHGREGNQLAPRAAKIIPEKGAEHDHRTQHQRAADVAEDL
jgi:hypothetical protein